MDIVNATEQYNDGLITYYEWSFKVANAICGLSQDEVNAFVKHLLIHLKVDGTFVN